MVRALPTYTQPIQGRWAHDQEIQKVWFGKGGGGRVYFRFLARASFRNALLGWHFS